jgi:hypothetical protein
MDSLIQNTILYYHNVYVVDRCIKPMGKWDSIKIPEKSQRPISMEYQCIEKRWKSRIDGTFSLKGGM